MRDFLDCYNKVLMYT